MAALSDIIILDQLDSTNRWSDLYDDIDNSQTASDLVVDVDNNNVSIVSSSESSPCNNTTTDQMNASTASSTTSLKHQQHQHDSEHDQTVALYDDNHEMNLEVKSLKMQLSHSKLQIQALKLNLKKYKSERDDLENNLAITTQDLLLLETKLKDIATFETVNHHSFNIYNKSIKSSDTPATDTTTSNAHTKNVVSYVDDVRGTLLTIANQRINELSHVLNDTRDSLQEQCDNHLNQVNRLTEEKKSLMEEMHRMSEIMNHKAILAATQLKKLVHTNRVNESYILEKSNEIKVLDSEVKRLSIDLQATDCERLKNTMSFKESDDKNHQLVAASQAQQQRLIALEDEVVDLRNENSILHNTIDRLRGSDMEMLERDLAIEMETVKRDAYIRETALMKQLTDCRSYIDSSDLNRDKLLDEVQQLNHRIASMSTSTATTTSTGTAAISSTSVEIQCCEDDFLDEYDSFFDHAVNDYVNMSISDNSHFAAMFDGIDEVEERELQFEDNDDSIATCMVEATDDTAVKYRDVPHSLLMGNDSIDHIDDDDCTSHADGSSQDKDKEILTLKDEVSVLREKEVVLMDQLHAQRRKLAYILKKASQLSIPVSDDASHSNNSTVMSAAIEQQQHIHMCKQLQQQEHVIACIEGEKNALLQQLDVYRDELKHMEMQLHQSINHMQMVDATSHSDHVHKAFESRIIELHTENSILRQSMATYQKHTTPTDTKDACVEAVIDTVDATTTTGTTTGTTSGSTDGSEAIVNEVWQRRLDMVNEQAKAELDSVTLAHQELRCKLEQQWQLQVELAVNEVAKQYEDQMHALQLTMMQYEAQLEAVQQSHIVELQRIEDDIRMFHDHINQLCSNITASKQYIEVLTNDKQQLVSQLAAATASASASASAASTSSDNRSNASSNTAIVTTASTATSTDSISSHSDDFSEYKKLLVNKCKRLLSQQHQQFVQERDDMLSLVKKEYEDLITDITHQQHHHSSSSSTSGNSNSMNTTIYPEMLSPEATKELVLQIARRSQNEDELRALLGVCNRQQ